MIDESQHPRLCLSPGQRLFTTKNAETEDCRVTKVLRNRDGTTEISIALFWESADGTETPLGEITLGDATQLFLTRTDAYDGRRHIIDDPTAGNSAESPHLLMLVPGMRLYYRENNKGELFECTTGEIFRNSNCLIESFELTILNGYESELSDYSAAMCEKLFLTPANAFAGIHIIDDPFGGNPPSMGCDCCLGASELLLQSGEDYCDVDDDNYAFVDNEGKIMVAVCGKTVYIQAKFCPNCGRQLIV